MGTRRFKLSQVAKNTASPLVATALQYDPAEDNAPRVVASGQRKIAEQILAEARKHNIPIHEDYELTAALATVNLGDEIPPELYPVIAEVLAYIYRIAKIHS